MDAVTLAGELRKLATNATRHPLMQTEGGPHWACLEAEATNAAELHRQYLEMVDACAVDALDRTRSGEAANEVYDSIKSSLRSREWFTTGLVFGVFVSSSALMSVGRLLDALLPPANDAEAARRLTELALGCTMTDVRRRVQEIQCRPLSARRKGTDSTPTSSRKCA